MPDDQPTDSDPSTIDAEEGRPDETEEAPAKHVECVTFDVAGEQYAIEVGRIRTIVDHPGTQRLPRTGEAVEGVAQAEGEVTVVVDLYELFGLDRPTGTEAEVVALDRGEGHQPVGVRVDGGTGIEMLPMAAMTPPGDAAIDDIAASEEFLLAVVSPGGEDVPLERPLYLLDVERVTDAAITAP